MSEQTATDPDTDQYDLIITDASVDGSAETVDIAVQDGRIARISDGLDASASEVVDAEGNFVSPGFTDCHTHLDRVYAACGARKPRTGPDSIEAVGFADYLNAAFDEYTQETPLEEIAKNAVADIQRAVSMGTTHIRSHVAVDHPNGMDNVLALLKAKEQTADLVDLQLVMMSSKGVLNNRDGEAKLREAVELSLEHDPGGQATLVGGADPASRNRSIERTFDIWFDIATDYDIGIDAHIQEGGLLGEFTFERLVRKMDEEGYQGRVTASHSFSLAHLPQWRLDELIPKMKAVDLALVTCYNSTRCGMPVDTLIRSGLALGHGTDNHRDFVIPHGDADVLAAVLTEVNKLHGDRAYDERYRWYETNEGLELLWDMITRQGARVLGCADEYGLDEGAPADLVVFDEASPQWAIINQAQRSAVIKRGRIVATDGELVPEFSPVEW